jgi:uncharacterized membrane protein YgaE (UPF0421/DUF939 family)
MCCRRRADEGACRGGRALSEGGDGVSLSSFSVTSTPAPPSIDAYMERINASMRQTLREAASGLQEENEKRIRATTEQLTAKLDQIAALMMMKKKKKEKK